MLRQNITNVAKILRSNINTAFNDIASVSEPSIFCEKKYDDCIKCFEKVMTLSPDYLYAYYSLGLAYEQKNDVDKALEYYYLYSGLEKDEKMLNVVNQKIKQLEK